VQIQSRPKLTLAREAPQTLAKESSVGFWYTRNADLASARQVSMPDFGGSRTDLTPPSYAN